MSDFFFLEFGIWNLEFIVHSYSLQDIAVLQEHYLLTQEKVNNGMSGRSE